MYHKHPKWFSLFLNALFPFVTTVGMVTGCFHTAAYSDCVALFALFTPWE